MQAHVDGEIAGLFDRALEHDGVAVDFRPALGFEPIGDVFGRDGTEGFAKAEVTAGGIDTAGLSSRSMAANHIGGLFAIGEAVDVTGWLGGYNFQWAWASGHAAGTAIAERVHS